MIGDRAWGGGVGGGQFTPLMAFTGKLSPKGASFSGFWYYWKGRDITNWNMQKEREICYCSLWKDLKGLTGAFYGWEKDKKTSWFSDLFIFRHQSLFIAGGGGAEDFRGDHLILWTAKGGISQNWEPKRREDRWKLWKDSEGGPLRFA